MIRRLQKHLTRKIMMAVLLGTAGMGLFGVDNVSAGENLVIDGEVSGDQIAIKVADTKETLTSNTITIADTSKVKGNVYAVYIVGEGKAEENKVIVAGNVSGNVAAVYSGYSNGIKNNTVEIMPTATVNGNVYGIYDNWRTSGKEIEGFSDNANHNNVIINGTSADEKVTITGNVYGSYIYGKSGYVNANDNKVVITNAIIKDSVYGAYAANALWYSDHQTSSRNTVSLTNCVVGGDVYGGSVDPYSYYSSTDKYSSDNKVALNNVTVTGRLFGGVARRTYSNRLTVSGVNQAKTLNGFRAFTFIVSEEHSMDTPVLTLTDTMYFDDMLDLDYLNNISVVGYTGNKTISLLKFNGCAIGTFKTKKGTDQITVADDAVYAVGNYTIELKNNSINYTADNCVVAGTYLNNKGEYKSANADSIGVLNLSSAVSASTIAGIYNKDTTRNSGNANGGTVNINGGTYDTVYGGFSNAGGTTTGNTVNLKGKGEITGTLSGGNNDSNISGNTLNVDSYFTVGKIKNFETINFIDESFTDDFAEPTLTVNGGEKWNLDNVKNISVDLNGKAKSGVYYLATAANGITNTTDTNYKITLNGEEIDNKPITTAGYVKSLGNIELGMATSKNGDMTTISKKSTDSGVSSVYGVDSLAVKISTDTVLAGKLIDKDGKEYLSKGGAKLLDGTESKTGELVLDGKSDANSIAGVYNEGSGNANDGHVIITGGTYETDVYGGYANSSDSYTRNNTVDLKGDGKITGTLSGGNREQVGNTLNVDSYFTAGNIKNFETINFLDEDFADDYEKPTLTVTDTLDFGNACAISVDMKGLSDDKLKKGVYYLATAKNGIQGTAVPQYTIKIDGTAKASGTSGAVAEYTISPITNAGYVKSVGLLKLGLADSSKGQEATINGSNGAGIDSIALGISESTKLAGKMILKPASAFESSGGVTLVDGTKSKVGDLVLDGSANADIISGVYNESAASGVVNGTNIYVYGGSYDSVYGVYSTEDVTANGTNVSWRNGSIKDTLAVGGDKAKAGTNNSLTIYDGAEGKSVKNLSGFDSYTLVMDSDTVRGNNTMLTVTGTEIVDLNNAAVSVDMSSVSTDELKRGVYYLATVNKGIKTDNTDYVIKIDGKDIKSDGGVAEYNIAPIVKDDHVKLVGTIKLGLAKAADGQTAEIKAKGTESEVDSIALGLGGDSVLAGKIIKADGETISSKEAGRLVLDGRIDADIIAGVYTEQTGITEVQGTNVLIEGGSYDKIYGVYSVNSDVTANGTNVFWRTGRIIDTLAVGGDKAKAGANNSLTIYGVGAGKSIKNLSGFDNYSFIIDSDTALENNTMLVVTGNEKMDLNNATVSVDLNGASVEGLKRGVYYLATVNKGIKTDNTDYVIKIDGKEVKSDGDIAEYAFAPVVNEGYVKTVGNIQLGLAKSADGQIAEIKAKGSESEVDSIALGISSDSVLAGKITKADGENFASKKDGILVLDGDATADVIAGVYTEKTGITEVQGTNVYIEGGSFDKVYGVYSANALVTANGTNVFWRAGSINDTLAAGNDKAKAGSNNSLTIFDSADEKSVGHLNGFDQYNFVLNNNSAIDKTILNVRENITAPDSGIIGIKVDSGESADYISNSKIGDKITLLNSKSELPDVNYEGIGSTFTHENMAVSHLVELKKDTNKIYAQVVDISTNKNSKALAEIQLGSSIAIDDAVTMTAYEGMKRASEAAASEANGEYAGFFGMTNGKTRRETGSYVEANGVNLMVGLARRMELTNGYVTNGMFLEHGNISLESHVNDLVATGKSKFYGLGWLTKRVLNNNLYVEGSAHIGKIRKDYNGDNKSYSPAHDSTSNYAGLHLGVGRTFKMGADSSWDIYTKYYFSRVGGADFNVGGFDVSLGAVNTHRLALGARWNKQLGDKTSVYAGAAINKTFGGDQNGTIHGYTMDTPTISGCYGDFELGASVKASKVTSIDFGVKAYAGDKKGVTGNVGVSFAF